jgi:hypothetical protein
MDELFWLLKWPFIILLAWTFIASITSPRRTFGIIFATWHHSFENQHFEALEFFKAVEEKIKTKDLKDVSVDIVGYNQEGFSFSKRKYLQIRRFDQMILVCASPFGTDYFISWRAGKPLDILDSILPNIPFIGKTLETRIHRKTYFQLDTDTMFKDIVHSCILKAIDDLTNTHGMRPLTDAERLPTDLQIKAMDI